MKYLPCIELATNGFVFFKALTDSHFIYQPFPNEKFNTLYQELTVFFELSENENREILVTLKNNQPPLLVPSSLYHAPASTYLKSQFDLEDNDAIFNDDIEEYKSLYFYPKNRITPFTSSPLNTSFRHITSALYQYLRQDNHGYFHKLVLFFRDLHTVDYVAIKNGKLLIINSFTYTSQHDILYFVLNFTKQNDIYAEDFLILLSGDVVSPQPLYEMLSQYLPHVKWATYNGNITIETSDRQPIDPYQCIHLLPF
ncbi:MAG TPA: DUF3822 family protein [Bacteroidales bacterium]|nr:DUF3822 family protein [Bacteroidales bacterium]HPT52646.1 DUF3822 family protein [Bacteroidales bacterium]